MGTAGPGTTSEYSRAEERIHCATHLVGIAFMLVAIPWLAVKAASVGDSWRLVSGVVFGASALLLFTSSVVYHSATDAVVKARLRKLDHSAIYVLIAGTYTPLAVGALRGGWGWTLFGLVWGLALAGVLAKTVFGFRSQLASTLLYVGMGWTGIVAIRPLMTALTGHEQAWILAGGLAYMAGVPFYVWKSRRYTHAIWHLFVLAGVACHFVAVLSVMAQHT
jgi:hemolysin III